MNTEEVVATIELTESAMTVIKEEYETMTKRMMGRMLHYPADRCANCDVRRALTLLERIVRL